MGEVEATVLTAVKLGVAGGDVICCPTTAVVAGLFGGGLGCEELLPVSPGCCSVTSCIWVVGVACNWLCMP